MRHMNRVLVGTMLEVAAGRRSFEQIRRAAARRSPRPRRAYGPRTRAGPRGRPTALRARAAPPGSARASPWRPGRGRVRRLFNSWGRGGPYAGRRCSNVLLTNDDGIEAEGLQALRRALGGARRRPPGGDRPRRQPLGDGALDHHAPAPVGGGGAVRRRHDRLRDRRHPGRLRAPREPRPGRGVRRRPGRRRDQPRREPRRRHHLLRDRRRGARGGRPRPAGDRRLPAVAARARSTTASTAASASRSRPASSRGSWRASTTCRCPERRCSTSTSPPASPAGVEVTSLGKRIYRDELKLEQRGGAPAAATGSTAPTRASTTSPAPTWRRSRRADRGHTDPLRPHRPSEPRGAAALRPGGAARPVARDA